jgi:hypothetical protein
MARSKIIWPLYDAIGVGHPAPEEGHRVKKTTFLKAALLGGTAVTLAACGGGGGGGSATTTPPAVAPSLQAQFGAAFNTDFMANPNSEPVVPQSGDIIALTLTAEPVSLH